MVLYFSGTGNSRYIAKRIAAVSGGQIVDINEKIKKQGTESIETGSAVIKEQHYKSYLLFPVRKSICFQGYRCLRWMREMCRSMSPEQYYNGRWETCME